MQQKDIIAFEAFAAVDMRVGRILEVLEFPEAKKPAYQLKIDLGPDLGMKFSSAQITEHYTPGMLTGRLVIAVVNMAPRKIAHFVSEVLVLGVADASGAVVLLAPDADVAAGSPIY